jgi:hypothetical protein
MSTWDMALWAITILSTICLSILWYLAWKDRKDSLLSDFFTKKTKNN